MATLKLVIIFSLCGVCLASLPTSPFGQAKQSKIMWSLFAPDKDAGHTDDNLVRKVRATGDDNLYQDKYTEEDVYWRPWNRQIPKDAVIGGMKEGECCKYPIYMAQVYRSGRNSALIPVEIFSKSRSVKSSYSGHQNEHRKDIKVLCARDSSILTWVSNSDVGRFNITADEDCVIGGSELEQRFNTFFGRTLYEEEPIIGKVLQHEKKMYFPYYGEEKMVQEYEILCYKTAIEKRKVQTFKKEEMDRMKTTSLDERNKQ